MRLAGTGTMDAVLPRSLAVEPIWLPVQKAAATARVPIGYEQARMAVDGRWTVRKRTVRVANPLGAGKVAGGGLLRYHDLDILMALSGLVLTSGATVRVPLPDLLRRIGNETLGTVAYDAVDDALRRLAAVELPFGSGDQPMVRLLSSYERVQQGRCWLVTVNVSDWWMESLHTGQWQRIDMASYRHLRSQFPKRGLVRAVYVFLASQRRPDDGICVAKDEMLSRYAPRRRDGRFAVYPLSDACPVVLAVRALNAARVVALRTSTAPWWSGWLCPDNAPTLDVAGGDREIPPPPPPRPARRKKAAAAGKRTARGVRGKRTPPRRSMAS